MKVSVMSVYECGHAGLVETERVKVGVAIAYAKLFAGPCPKCKKKGVKK